MEVTETSFPCNDCNAAKGKPCRYVASYNNAGFVGKECERVHTSRQRQYRLYRNWYSTWKHRLQLKAWLAEYGHIFALENDERD